MARKAKKSTYSEMSSQESVTSVSEPMKKLGKRVPEGFTFERPSLLTTFLPQFSCSNKGQISFLFA